MNGRIKELEQELSRLKNGGFSIPYSQFKEIPHQTETTKRIIMRFARYLSEKRILLEICSQSEYALLFSVFKQKENQSKYTKRQKERLKDIILRSRLFIKRDEIYGK